MRYELLALAALLAGGAGALRVAQLSRLRRLSVQRVGIHSEEITGETFADLEPIVIDVYPRRFHFAGPVAAVLTFAGIFFLTQLPLPFPIAFGILMGVILYLFEVYWRDARIEKIESQLADAIDQMISSLRAGSALLGALEASFRESKPPLRQEFENVIRRIRLGEDPQTVVRELPMRVPLESFRLFAYSLLVHWETGGSLATSLRTVGRTVRDRLEVSRRISAQAIESQFSVGAVMLIAYAVTALTFFTNPESIAKWVYSQIGSYIGAAVIILQAIGMFWIWRMSRIRF